MSTKEYHRLWHLQNKDKARASYERQARRGREVKARLIRLLGGKCIDCGFAGHPVAMDFDHREPQLKHFQISDVLRAAPWEVLVAEAQKCDLRCANCHRIKTFVRKGVAA